MNRAGTSASEIAAARFVRHDRQQLAKRIVFTDGRAPEAVVEQLLAA